ncbi:cytochrome oxidase assembly protein 1 [Malassezia cuniculi]|uniref:Cytochrome oxidase assembly protein 1 n=1 Tax=Malassezia cuniculi TaxID=948313 RepID=A0AAF0ERT8_9BASI|nr:cytochrome oxidase assembly protein 1 [Malassezia cuniculi]
MASMFASVWSRMARVGPAAMHQEKQSSRILRMVNVRMMSTPAGPGHWEARTTRVKSPIPRVPNKMPVLTAAFISMTIFWYYFASHMNNRERLNSSVMRMVKTRVKESPQVHALVGEPVNLERGVIGDPWINGEVNPLKGKVDISFRIVGPLGAATTYFTSVRPQPQAQFEVLRFLVVPDGDSNRAVSLLDARAV